MPNLTLTAVRNYLDHVIRFLLFVCIFWLPYSGAVIEVTINVGFLLWCLKRMLLCAERIRINRSFSFSLIVQSFRPPQSVIDWPILLFLIFSFLSAFFTEYRDVAVPSFFRKTLEWFLVYYLVLEVFTKKKHYVTAIGFMFFTATAVALDAYWQVFSGYDLFNRREIGPEGRATASFKYANSLAAYIAPLTAGYFCIILRIKKIFSYKALLLIGFFVFGTALILTQSRIGCVAVGLTLVLQTLIYKNYKVLFAVVIALIMLGVFVNKGIGDGPWAKRLSSDKVQKAMKWRLGIWQDTLKMIKAKPWLGHGLNQYMPASKEYRRKQNIEGTFQPFPPAYAHNCYLQVFAESGVFAGFAFLWIIWGLVRELFGCLIYILDDSVKILISMMSWGIIIYLIHAFFDVHFYSLQLFTHFWFLAALGIGLGANRLVED